MDVVHQEHTFVQSGDQPAQFGTAETLSCLGGSAVKTIKNSFLISISLKSSYEPGARICQSLVIQVNRILSSQDDPDSESPCHCGSNLVAVT